jgi:hypothetical protein
MNGPLELVLHYITLERLAMDKHSSFLGPFISYEEKKHFKFGPRKGGGYSCITALNSDTWDPKHTTLVSS